MWKRQQTDTRTLAPRWGLRETWARPPLSLCGQPGQSAATATAREWTLGVQCQRKCRCAETCREKRDSSFGEGWGWAPVGLPGNSGVCEGTALSGSVTPRAEAGVGRWGPQRQRPPGAHTTEGPGPPGRRLHAGWGRGSVSHPERPTALEKGRCPQQYLGFSPG